MAKRFFSTDKFKDAWYRSLPMEYKLLWDLLLCECSHAGIVILDLEIYSILIGKKLSMGKFRELFADKVFNIKENIFFIPNFVTFQYSNLSTKNKATASVIKELNNYGIELELLRTDEKGNKYYNLNRRKTTTCLAPLEVAVSNSVGVKDKDKDKDKDKVKEKEPIKPSSPKGAVAKLSNHDDCIDVLKTVSHALQNRWLTQHSPSWIKKEITGIKTYLIANPAREIKNMGAFISNWFGRSKNSDDDFVSTKSKPVSNGKPSNLPDVDTAAEQYLSRVRS